MTCVTGLFLCVFFAVDLRETARLGDILGMAAHTKCRYIRSQWFYRAWIVCMFRLRAMTRFAVNVRMRAFGFDLQYVRMAAFAGFVAGVSQGSRGNVPYCVSAVKTVASKALRNYGGAKGHEGHYPRQENRRQANQVRRIPKLTHRRTSFGRRTRNVGCCWHSIVEKVPKQILPRGKRGRDRSAIGTALTGARECMYRT
jgi:hypothetical protein